MRDLNKIREEINKVDESLSSLFEKRMELAKQVAEYKKENSIPIADAARENLVVQNNLKLISNEEIKPYYVNFIKSVMDISKEYQYSLMNGLKISYSGIEGSYGYIAAKRMYPNCEFISAPNFALAYKNVEDGKSDRAVLPLENSFAGDIGEVMDLIFKGSLYINRMYDLEVEHCLLSLDDANMSDIDTVISHPQALEQCSKFIEDHNYKTIEEVNTAFAARRLKEAGNKNCAVIASKENAKLFGLKILEEKINNLESNKTRFAAFSRILTSYSSEMTSKKNFILVFTVKNVAGALAKCLDVIGVHGFNMRNLKSRPLKNLMWQYYFFCEIEGDLESEQAKQMMTALKPFCDMLKVAGNYII